MGGWISDFASSAEAWSWFAIEAPIETVAAQLEKREGVFEYERGEAVAPPFKGTREVWREPDRRRAYVFREKKGKWTVGIVTIFACDALDKYVVDSVAGELSAALGTRAVASSAPPGKYPELRVFRGGRKESTTGGLEDMEALAKKLQLRIPACFITYRDGGSSAFHANLDAERLDRIVIARGKVQTSETKTANKPSRVTTHVVRGAMCTVTRPDGSSMAYDIGGAAAAGETQAVEKLVESGVDVNQTNEVGDTALHCACIAAQWDTVKALVALGADVDLKNDVRSSARSYAAADPTGAAAKALGLKPSAKKPATNAADKSAGASIAARVLCSAIERSDPKELKRLLRLDLPARALSDGLARAATGDDVDAIRTLVKAGADPSGPPLCAAAGEGKLESVRVLLELGADPKHKGEDGETPLQCANAGRFAEVAALLRGAGKGTKARK